MCPRLSQPEDRGELQSFYGLPGARYLWCCVCAAFEWAVRATPPEERISTPRKCFHAGCKIRASCGTVSSPRQYCAEHVKQYWDDNEIPLEARVNSHGNTPTLESVPYSANGIACMQQHQELLHLLVPADVGVVEGGEIQHGKSTQGEHALEVDGHRYRADGYFVVRLAGGATVRVCLEFNGCMWHGCPRCNQGREGKKFHDKTMLTRKMETDARVLKISEAGHLVVEIWECEWERMMADKTAQLIAEHVAGVRERIRAYRYRPSVAAAAGTVAASVAWVIIRVSSPKGWSQWRKGGSTRRPAAVAAGH